MSYDVLMQLVKSGKYNVETWTELLLPVLKEYI
jgi:hypothetical protein